MIRNSESTTPRQPSPQRDLVIAMIADASLSSSSCSHPTLARPTLAEELESPTLPRITFTRPWIGS